MASMLVLLHDSWLGKRIGWAWLALLTVVASGWLLLTLLIIWLAQGADRIDGLYVPFISDIGARHQAVFIVGCALLIPVAILQISVLNYLQWKRGKQNRLQWTPRDTFLSLAVIAFTILSSTALLLLSIYDNIDFSTAHGILAWLFFLFFFVGMLLITLHLWLWYIHARRLGRGPIAGYYKTGATTTTAFCGVILVLGVVAIALVVAFDSSDYGWYTAVSVLEWVIAVGYIAFLGSLLLVMQPLRGMLEQQLQRQQQHQRDVESGGIVPNTGLPNPEARNGGVPNTRLPNAGVRNGGVPNRGVPNGTMPHGGLPSGAIVG